MAKQTILTWTRIDSPDEKTEDTDLEVASGDFDGVPAIVKRSFGFTLNLGNFQSLRVDAGVEVPCAPDADQIEAASEWADQWAESKVKEVIDRARSKKSKG